MNETDRRNEHNPAASTGSTSDKPLQRDEEKEREHAADEAGNEAGDALRGGRLPEPEATETRKGPRPADDSAHSAIPCRSFDL